jgi:hypothetical protein
LLFVFHSHSPNYLVIHHHSGVQPRPYPPLGRCHPHLTSSRRSIHQFVICH